MPEEHLHLQEDPNNPLYEIADKLSQQTIFSIKDLVMAIQRHILEHNHSLPESHQPKTIIESRFTTPAEAYAKGMVSCGAMANIGTAMLRHLGYQVKFVHGEVPQSVDHAWISVYDPQTRQWQYYDLTRKDGRVTPDHKVKHEVDSWEDIRDQIELDHLTLYERRRQKP